MTGSQRPHQAQQLPVVVAIVFLQIDLLFGPSNRGSQETKTLFYSHTDIPVTEFWVK